MIGNGMTKINKKLERKYGVINMFKLTLLKTDDTIEDHHFKHEPTFQDMYPLINYFVTFFKYISRYIYEKKT